MALLNLGVDAINQISGKNLYKYGFYSVLNLNVSFVISPKSNQ